MQDYHGLVEFSRAVAERMSAFKDRQGVVVGSSRYLGRNQYDGSQSHQLIYAFRVYRPLAKEREQKLVLVSRLLMGVNIERGDWSIEESLEANLREIQRVLAESGPIRVENRGNSLRLETRI